MSPPAAGPAEAPDRPATPPDSRPSPPRRLARPESAPAETAPRFARPLARALGALDAVLDRAYGSRWNPAHQSGPLAVAMMLVAIATGIYLLLVYRIGAPYESIVRIQADPWLGRWMRALHRYTSDLAVAFVALHALRMLVQGRTWGARVLAWVTGLVLAGLMLVVGWTGYVLVWDEHGRLLGAAGARLMDALHLMSAPIGRVFGGGAPAPASFFFLNLFVHMALPLAMVLLLWVHTLRLARSRWLPERPLFAWVTAAVTVLSVIVPAPLGPGADGLTLGDRAAYDLFYTAWVPLVGALSPAAAWAALAALALAPLTVPIWWRPRAERRGEPSHHNPLACTGCGQCVVDCPFEAIAMVPNTTLRGTHPIASVNAARCVSCGLCAGSCDQLAIGPPSRGGHAQVQAVRLLAASADLRAFVLVHCGHDGVGERLAARIELTGRRVVPLQVDCAGELHALAVSQLAERHRGVFVLGCPPNRCRSREGVRLALGRLLQGREPELKRPLDAKRVRFASGGAADLAALAAEFERFEREAGTRGDAAGFFAGRVRGVRGVVAAAAASVVVLGGTAWLSQLPAGAAPAHGAVRLAWRLPGQSWRDCRPLSPAEIAKLPAHMRRTEECRTVHLHYRLRAWVDGRPALDREVAPLGARGDRPLYVEERLEMAPGERRLRVEFVPLDDPHGAGARLVLDRMLEVTPGRARLVFHDAAAGALDAR